MKSKNILISTSLMLSSILAAQIGIGTTNVSSSEVLKVAARLPGEAANAPGRGILFPRIALSNETDATTILNPAHALALYNTSGLPGFFYWDSLITPKRWRRLMDTPGVMELMVPIRNETSTSTGGASQATATGQPVAYTIGEAPTVRSWVKVPGMQKTISIYKTSNNITIIASVPLQLNNSGSGSSYDTHSFAVGIFVDNKLASVRPFIISGPTSLTCIAQSSEIKTDLANLSVANHTIEIYVITRNILDGNATHLTWTTPASGCTSYHNAFMTTGNLSVQTQQF